VIPWQFPDIDPYLPVTSVTLPAAYPLQSSVKKKKAGIKTSFYQISKHNNKFSNCIYICDTTRFIGRKTLSLYS
jgi:hypothetical protein